MCAVCMCNLVTATASNTGKLSKLSSTSNRYYTKAVEAHYSPARARCNDAAAALHGVARRIGGGRRRYDCGNRLDSSAAEDSARLAMVYAGGTAALLRRYCGGTTAALRRPNCFLFSYLRTLLSVQAAVCIVHV